MSKDKSAAKGPLKKPSKIAPNKKIATNVPAKKLTEVQSERLRILLAQSPPIEKLDPQIYAKLQATIHEVVEKTMPAYKKWLNSEFGVVEICSSCGNDCPIELCSSCSNDCPTPVEPILNRVTKEAINAAMNVAINFSLAQATSKEGAKQVSETKVRAAFKEQLIRKANEIGTEK